MSLCLFICKDEEDVDVGIGEEILAAVAAQGEQGGIGGRLAGECAAPHLDQHAVYDGGTASNGGSAVTGAFAGLADEQHLLRILLPKIVNRQGDWIHKSFWWLSFARRILNSISEVGGKGEGNRE